MPQRLVWSGACQFDNQNTCDFRAWNFNGTDYLSAIFYKNHKDPVGRGIVLSKSYQKVSEQTVSSELAGMNMHEFNLVNNGTAAIYIIFRAEMVNVTSVSASLTHGWITNMGFREIDVRTGDVLFEWWAHPKVSLEESNVAVNHNELTGPFPNSWNWFHANSVNKNEAGDYLVSSRYTNTIFKISGSTGNVIWRLGGQKSDFELKGFNFSRQHDAHWIESECNHSGETITFLDNGSDGITTTSNISTAYKVWLDKGRMTANIIQSWDRPDNRSSQLRGNFQLLPSENVFASWSDNAFISEHTSDGKLVMAAEFGSSRFVTYRAYKFNFTGTPIDPPSIAAFVHGVDAPSSTTVIYTSWNGATEINYWDFYSIRSEDGEVWLGSVAKTDFESRFYTTGFENRVYANAMSIDGTILGRTNDLVIEPLPEWEWETSIETDVFAWLPREEL